MCVCVYILHFMKIRPVLAQYFHAGRKTDRHTWRSWYSIFAGIRIVHLFSLSVAIQTVVIRKWHTASSIHNILLQFPHHTALKATNPPSDHTVLDRVKSYIFCTFLLQYTSCVMLFITSYEYPYINPGTWSVANQFHYQLPHCKAELQLLLNN